MTTNSSSDKGQKTSNILGSLFFLSEQTEESNIHQSSQEAVSSITFYFAAQGATHFPQYRLYRVSQTDVLLLLDRPLLPSGVQSRQKLLQNMMVEVEK